MDKDTLRSLRTGITVAQKTSEDWMNVYADAGSRGGEPYMRHQIKRDIMRDLVGVIDSIVGPE